MEDIQVNERGQITIPKKMRDKANIYPKDWLRIKLNEKGELIIFKPRIFNDVEEMIMQELRNQGVPEAEFEERLQEKKKELARQLLEE
ncbi:AbrB/MazE/SpoVT family DNA-binding domain-containing protein [Aneurinibacillus aneurinilyticus]|uniref:AbrB/MazE/SpoVT family DNA-binding domain-containing protein n=1 Tax=Aneurinibacillus aneurinilyticus TaxID=1391 RepID=UPI0023F11F27|nr:AbrB/MazE/SpoVT family DNA-binding domain-containing protein [Aneurinibacillus aneurinilyticus]